MLPAATELFSHIVAQMNTDLVTYINKSLETDISQSISIEGLRTKLAAHINHLINHDFEKLVFYLYRIDVNESKMRAVLDNRQHENAGDLIADLIIERQLEKIEARKNNIVPKNIPEDEKW
jgi:hypothetical protein